VYQVPQLQSAAALDEAAHQAFTDGALFFGGVCTKIGWRPAQLALLGLAVVLLIYVVQQIGALPDGSSWGLTPRWG
jgi:hypothetical protein